jgi:redox-sensitive bicupin YhaK (pirin superfamily)
LPRFLEAGVDMRLMMGSAYGHTSPVKTFVDTLYLEAHMTAGQAFQLPVAEELAVYVAGGNIRINDEDVSRYSMAVLERGSSATVHALDDACIAIIGGESMPERYIDWNFVSSRKERIAQAREDWKARRFPLVPGDEEEFIPLD